MFGKKKRDRWAEDGFPEEEEYLEEDDGLGGTERYSQLREDEDLNGETGKYYQVREEQAPEMPYPEEENGPEDGYYPEEEYYPEGEAPEGENWGQDEWTEEEWEEEPEKKPEPRSIFKPDVRKPNFVLSVLVNTVRVLILVGILAGVAVLGSLVGIAKGYVDTAPELDLVALDTPDQNTEFMDRNRNLLTVYRGTENRIAVPLASIPQRLRNAFVAVEDARFYTHSGVDLKRIVGAFVANLTTSGTQGGSTITQQLIKNTLLSSEQSYKRKIQEAYLALQLETKYSKDQILENYLNKIYLGENYYGVKVAAKGYFNKELSELTLRECAMLAGVTNNPYYYNPRRNFYTRNDGEKDYAELTNNRTNYVLRCMYENQFITKEEYEAALDPATASVTRTEENATGGMYSYPHYIEYAVKECVQILLEVNGLPDTAQNRAAMETKLRTGGYKVQLAIDPNIQQTVEETLQNWTKYPSLRDPSDKVYRSKNSDGTYTEIIQPQAACAVLDYRTGELLAVVGSRSEVTARKTMNRATDMKMPVGSSIKPISVYAPAIELGASPASVIYNMPLPISGWKDSRGNDSFPKNYGGAGYTGPETLRTGMAKSHNTAAAQTLLGRVGVERSVNYLHSMGIDDDHIDKTPFGLSLGSSGITPLQMTVAFGVLANGGVYQEPISVLGISDSHGDVVWDGHQHQERHRVFKESTSYLIVDMMKSVVSSGTGTSAKIKGQVVGGKTGTNSDQKGVFFAGVTGYYSSALWIGHDNYKALSSKSTGSGAAAPLWQAYMSKIHEGLAKKEILDGDPSMYGLVQVTTCVVSGQLATDACRNDASGYGVVTDYWAEGTQPTQYCQMHQVQNVCAESGMPASPYCPNVVQKGVVVLQAGQPLATFLGTEYQSVLEEYLHLSTDNGGATCDIHGGGYSNYVPDGGSALPNRQAQDAAQIIAAAQQQLATLDPASAQYAAIVNAATRLQQLVDSGAAQSEVTAAMTALTQAMIGIY
ncbi:MAG: PBP1A family penicillin-binding protein [Clostridia bacterium]|nr:PBP1A family penicillin-binding protein [Clostridia bacterium]